MTRAAHPGPICSEEVEAWLRSRGANFLRCMEIPLTQIDEQASRRNQARPTAIVTDAVDRYALAVWAGDKFPPIVVYRPGGSGTKFVIIDGNNRQAAFKRAGKVTIAAYVLASDTANELIHLLTVEANARHGEVVSTEWRVRQAMHLRSIGWSLEVACRAAAISAKVVRERQVVLATDLRARDLHVKNWLEIPVSTRYVLAALADDPVLFHAARLVIDTVMTGEEARALVRAVKLLPSERARLDHITTLHEQRSAEREAHSVLKRSVHSIKSPKHNLISGIGKILAVDAGELARAILTDLEKRELHRRLIELAERVIELQIAVEDALTEEVVTDAG